MALNLPEKNKGAAVSPFKNVENLLERMRPALEKALPKHLNPDRLSRIALTEIRKTPKLLECDPHSLMGAVMQAAQLGLEPGSGLGQCYLIPYKTECTFVIGYQGLIELFYRSGQVMNIFADKVCENDEFEFERGSNSKLFHKPADGERGRAVKYYAHASLKNGGEAFVVMSVEEVQQHRDRFSKAKNFGPWKDNFDSMAIKTCVRGLAKWLPKSADIVNSLQADGEQMRIDETTGEVFNPEPIEAEAVVE